MTAVRRPCLPEHLPQGSFAFGDSDANFLTETPPQSKRTGAFTDNMSLPVHRWFRYSAGFSAEWVERLIDKHDIGCDDYLLDPFAGSGTTLLAARKKNVKALGAESHAFVRRIANAKLASDTANVTELTNFGHDILRNAKVHLAKETGPVSPLLAKCYTSEALHRLVALRRAFLENDAARGCCGELAWLAITSILRECSGVGTAQWQYVLPNKTKARVQDPFAAFLARIDLFCSDIQSVNNESVRTASCVELCDARDLSPFGHLRGKIKFVVTSPPYPNNYDYADATRLEMTFWQEIDGWGDLQQAVRRHLVRSCSQHSAAERLSLDELLADDAIAPIRAELTDVCARLGEIRETKGGRKTYHTMVAAYFADLARVWKALHPLCAAGADAYFVIGDSAPYGIHVPVERWLGELALAAGFRSWTFEKIRDRNTKWKNRKHRVPLQEGNLWVKN